MPPPPTPPPKKYESYTLGHAQDVNVLYTNTLLFLFQKWAQLDHLLFRISTKIDV